MRVSSPWKCLKCLLSSPCIQEARTQIVVLLRRITANVMFSFQILVGYSGRNWKCRVCVLWELLRLQQGASEKLGTEILLRAQAVTFWVNQMCRSPGGAAVQLSALSGENWAVASSPLDFSVGFMVSLKVAYGSAQFSYRKKHLLNLGTLFHFPSSEGLGKVLSQLVLSDISAHTVTSSSENESDSASCTSVLAWRNALGFALQGHCLWTCVWGCMGLPPVKITSLFLR